jgi:hypothetical protein
MRQFDWPITKKIESMEAPQTRRFYGKMECHPLWPTYIGEKGRTLGKTYGIKARCYWEHLWRTHWEPIKHCKNMMEPIGDVKGTCWEQKKKEKISPTPKLKRKKSRHFECMLSLPIGCMKFLFPKLFATNNPIINWWYLFIWRQPTIT